MRLLGPLPDFQGTLTRAYDPVADYGDTLARKAPVDLRSLGNVGLKIDDAEEGSDSLSLCCERERLRLLRREKFVTYPVEIEGLVV